MQLLQMNKLIKIQPKLPLPIVLLFVILLGNFMTSFAQTGSIEGHVFDKDMQEPLIGAAVMIEIASTGASSDDEGNFNISNISVGTYSIKISYLGYDTKVIENVNVLSGQKTILNVALSETVGELAVVEVVAFRKTNTESAMLMEIKNTDLMASGISAQQIGKSMDRDAAQVVKRVPGVTLMGNFINIRGLNPRYNSVLLHNATVPSLETDIKSFSFDMIPSGQIDRMLIMKSPSAELPGDFAGGVVKVFTKSIPNENFYTLHYSTQFRLGTTLKDFYQSEQNALFHLGFDNQHGLPANFPKDLRKSSAEELTKAGRSMTNDWVANKSVAIPDQRIAFTMGHRIIGKKVLIGEITAINYSNSRSIYNVKRSDYNVYNPENKQSSVIYDFDDTQYNSDVKLGLIHNWSFRFKKGSTIDFKNLANFSSSAQYIHRGGEHYEFSYFPNNYSFDQVFKGIYSGQIIGHHELSEGAANLDWLVGIGYTYRNQPDYKRYRSDLDTSTGTSTLYVPIGNAQPFFLGRFYSNMKELLTNAQVNYSYKIGYKKSKKFLPTLSSGINVEYKDRTFGSRNIGFIRSPQFDINHLNKGIDELFQQENINTTTGVILDEQSNPSDSYTANNLLGAAYAKIELPIQNFKVVAGVRYELFQQKLNSATLTNDPINVNRTQHSILPSINTSYSFMKNKMVARLAYGMTVNHPEFREIAPFGFYDFNYNFTFSGNPKLVSASIHHAELKWEYYPSISDVINFSVFYKRFINPIEVVIVQGAGGSGGSKSFTFNNANNANLYGAEIELKKSFTKSSNKILKNTGVMLNATYLISNVYLGENIAGQSNNRPLQGQSPYVINSGIFYNNQEKNYQINLMYNVSGKKIMFVGSQDYPDIYEMPRHTLDLSASYQFPKNVEITAGISDILQSKVLWLQDGNNDGKFDRKNDQMIQKYQPGSVINLGVKYNFK
jgi:outer membrane receptor for ferrienterochelin and colicin